jgi:hypothetical protein
MLPPASDRRRAARWMRAYRAMGYNPLPSSSYKKQPKVAFRRVCGWDQIGPDSWLDIPTVNIQVMTGVPWRLAAIDLDGPTAVALWESWTLYRPVPPTWRVASDPAKGMHVWFTLPDSVESCPKRFLWRLEGEKHAAIEVIGDRSLITAPPSRHVRTGRRYRFLPGSSPRSVPRPAEMPGWLVEKCSAPAVELFPRAPVTLPAPAAGCRARYLSRDVLAAIPDKGAVAKSFDLRIVGDGPNHDGWLECRAIGRDDHTPSASFNIRSGFYIDHRDGVKLGLFEVAVATGHAPSWIDAMNMLGDHYSAPPRNHHEARRHGHLARTTATHP